ncbi:MAG: hypothetical protein IPF41_15295 [Flavobacteriales bacterium]|nr:hypothetical protein [Flavobacteriales bacterium]
MRFTVLLLLLIAMEATAQFGIGIQIPVGRSTQRLGTVPDSLATYAPKELDIQPQCTLETVRWLGLLASDARCDSIPLASDCYNGETVTMRFTVERDGSVSELQLVKGGCPSLEQRLQCGARHAPPWQPGRIGYHKVRTRMQIRSCILLR